MEENILRQRKINESGSIPSTDNNNIRDETSNTGSGKNTNSKQDDAITTVKSKQTTTSNKNEDHTLTTKEAYFEQLKQWTEQTKMQQQAMSTFPYYMMANYPHLLMPPPPPPMIDLQQATFAPHVPTSVLPNLQSHPFGYGFHASYLPQPQIPLMTGGSMQTNPFQRPASTAPPVPQQTTQPIRLEGLTGAERNEAIINHYGGYEYLVAPLWKRFAAEIIDVLLLFLLKLVITFTLVDVFNFDLGIELDFDLLKSTMEIDDYSDILAFTSDFLALEIITKIMVCFYEAIWTMKGHGIIGGGTPGKILLGIRIVHITGVVSLDPQGPMNIVQYVRTPIRTLIYPATNLGFFRALCRAMAKNILMTLLFPMCFFMFFFRNNQTGYDLMTKTIVVEENPNPVLRRR